MNLETEIYQILKKHKLTLKKREEVIVDLLVLIKADQAEQLILPDVVGRSEQLCYYHFNDIESTKCLSCGDESCLDAECLQ